jgi:hypothetical protein
LARRPNGWLFVSGIIIHHNIPYCQVWICDLIFLCPLADLACKRQIC